MSKTHWNSSLYDNSHGYISNYGSDLLTWLAPSSGERILDAGCATGGLTDKIAKSGVEVVGIDSSPDMIKAAKEKYPSLHFEVADIKTLPFSNEFDAVFSNAVLHWVKEADAAIAAIHRSLKPGGRFVAEMGGENNVATIVNSIDRALAHFGFPQNQKKNPWTFFSVEEYASRLETGGFVIKEVIYFDRPTELDKGKEGLRNWLMMFADTFFQGIPQPKVEEMFSFIEEDTRNHLFRGEAWWADYKRLRVKVKKPDKV